MRRLLCVLVVRFGCALFLLGFVGELLGANVLVGFREALEVVRLAEEELVPALGEVCEGDLARAVGALSTRLVVRRSVEDDLRIVGVDRLLADGADGLGRGGPAEGGAPRGGPPEGGAPRGGPEGWAPRGGPPEGGAPRATR